MTSQCVTQWCSDCSESQCVTQCCSHSVSHNVAVTVTPCCSDFEETLKGSVSHNVAVTLKCMAFLDHLQCVVVCCSMLMSVAACCSVLQRVAVRCSYLGEHCAHDPFATSPAPCPSLVHPLPLILLLCLARRTSA